MTNILEQQPSNETSLILRPGVNCRVLITHDGKWLFRRGENWYHFDGKNHYLVNGYDKEGRPTTKENS